MDHGAGGDSFPQRFQRVLGDFHQRVLVPVVEVSQQFIGCLLDVLSHLPLLLGHQVGFGGDWTGLPAAGSRPL